MRYCKGFSLVEVMIAVAIIGILAGVAVPSYNSYLIKTKVSEASNLGGQYLKKITEYYSFNGAWPNATNLGLTSGDNTWAPRSTNTSFPEIIEGLYINNGQMDININHAAAGLDAKVSACASDVIWVYKFTETNDIVTFTCCKNACTQDSYIGYLPADCRTLCS
jgi:prepilin-type N-terminal cleavage/methylation domain-containing protein